MIKLIFTTLLVFVESTGTVISCNNYNAARRREEEERQQRLEDSNTYEILPGIHIAHTGRRRRSSVDIESNSGCLFENSYSTKLTTCGAIFFGSLTLVFGILMLIVFLNK